MRQIATHLLWLGHAGDGRDFRQILDVGIQAVIQVAAEEPVLEIPRDLVYCRFPLVDGKGNDPRLLQLTIKTVASLLEKKVPTLVVCGAGMSRSPAIAAAALAVVFQDEPDQCLQQVIEHRPADISPALWHDIKLTIAKQIRK
jgi:protein-tyrosine phosphatase